MRPRNVAHPMTLLPNRYSKSCNLCKIYSRSRGLHTIAIFQLENVSPEYFLTLNHLQLLSYHLDFFHYSFISFGRYSTAAAPSAAPAVTSISFCLFCCSFFFLSYYFPLSMERCNRCLSLFRTMSNIIQLCCRLVSKWMVSKWTTTFLPIQPNSWHIRPTFCID